jgi:uncharacterized protein
VNKRLRKKKRVGEFQELGIEVSCTVDLASEDIEFDIWTDDFVRMIESLNLSCGGGGSFRDWSVCVSKHKGSVSEEDKKSISKWLTDNKYVKDFEISDFFDVWY